MYAYIYMYVLILFTQKLNPPPLPLPHKRAQHENVTAAAGVLKRSQSAVTLEGVGLGNRAAQVFPASHAQPSGTCVRACVCLCVTERMCVRVCVCVYMCACALCVVCVHVCVYGGYDS